METAVKLARKFLDSYLSATFHLNGRNKVEKYAERTPNARIINDADEKFITGVIVQCTFARLQKFGGDDVSVGAATKLGTSTP